MLLVTRPREQAQDWVARLQAAGVPAHAVPLLGIAPADTQADHASMRDAWTQLQACRAVMFVSPNAVQAFFKHATVGRPAWPEHTWAIAPGPGTAAALVSRGIPPLQIVQPPTDAPQFDSEALWPELARLAWNNQDVMVVRGEGGRDWLIQRWQQAGARVHTVVVYRRGAPLLLKPEVQGLQWALAHPDRAVWLWSSSEALDHLAPLIRTHAPQVSLSAWAPQVRALATHARIVERARTLGFAQVLACRADLSSVVAASNNL